MSPQARLNAFFQLQQTESIFRPTSSFIGFQHFIAVWKAFTKRKQIAQFLLRNFALTFLKGICIFLVPLEYTFWFFKILQMFLNI